MWTIKDIARAESHFPNESIYVCTTCFRLTSFNRKWVRCFCEPPVEVMYPESIDPSWVVLCVLCARAVDMDRTGMNWKACPSCIRFNSQLKGRIGIDINMSRVDPAAYLWAERFEPDEIARKKITNGFDQMKRDWERIFNWSLHLARELWQSVPEWANEKYIGADAWEVRFPHSAEISEQMLLRMTGYESMTDLKEAVAKLQGGGETTTDPTAGNSAERTYFEIPENIAQMSDDEIKEWSMAVYEQFMSGIPDTLAESAPPVVLTSRFLDAMNYANLHHAGQTRKASNIAYISHPFAVAGLVIEARGDEDQAIGGLLHDVAEDCGGEVRLQEIKEKFGTRVEAIVRGCSDSLTAGEEEKAPWRVRKETHIAHLWDANDDVLLVTAADKTHNARAIVTDLDCIGPVLWNRFNATSADIVWYYESVYGILKIRGVTSALLSPLATSIEAMKRHV